MFGSNSLFYALCKQGDSFPFLGKQEYSRFRDLFAYSLECCVEKVAEKFVLTLQIIPLETPKFPKGTPTKPSPLFPSPSLSTAACFSFSQFLMCRVCNCTAADILLCVYVCVFLAFCSLTSCKSNTTRFRDRQRRHRQT